jgi:hypothetical protein
VKQANETFDDIMKTIGLDSELARATGKGYLDQALMKAVTFQQNHPTLTSGIGYGLGGAALGSMVPSRDKEGKSHRLRNALIGGLLAGSGAAGVKEYNAPTNAISKLPSLLTNAQQAAKTMTELVQPGPLSNEYRLGALKGIFNQARNLNLGLMD